MRTLRLILTLTPTKRQEISCGFFNPDLVVSYYSYRYAQNIAVTVELHVLQTPLFNLVYGCVIQMKTE